MQAEHGDAGEKRLIGNDYGRQYFLIESERGLVALLITGVLNIVDTWIGRLSDRKKGNKRTEAVWAECLE